MKAALIGLMQSGKSTLMSAITGKQASMIGSTSIDEAVGTVPDERLIWLDNIYHAKKVTYAAVNCLDVPGLNLGDESGRASAVKLINQVRSADMFVLVVRAFDNGATPPDPKRDLRELNSEILLADLEMVTTRVERLQQQANRPTKNQKHDQEELALQLRLQEALENEKPLSTVTATESELEIIRSLNLLTLKPFMVVVNTSEADIDKVIDFAGVIDESVAVVNICCKLEQELSQLDDASRREFMNDIGIKEPAINKFMKNCYSTLGLISFLTSGEDEIRAWPILKGTTALDAAGKIHSDIKRGFIRAETIAYSDMVQYGSEKAVKAAGKARLEGKTYIVQDGDIINFRFNV